MSYQNPLLPKQYLAGGTVEKYRLVAFSAKDTVVEGAAVADLLIGVADHDAASGERVRVNSFGIIEVIAGGAVTRGNPVTTDANGAGVAAAPATGVNNRIIGYALMSGVAGDIIPVAMSLGEFQGA